MKIIVRDRISGKRYELDILEEHTAKDVIDVLVEERLIRPSPGEGYEWILVDPRFIQIPPNERVASRLSGAGENEVFLIARFIPGNESLKPSILKIEEYNPDDDVASRQKLIPNWDQELLKKTHVLVAGAGALGNEIIKNLILLGFGKIYVVDFDTVVKSNLNRCVMLRTIDVELKTSKAEAVAKRGKELDPYGYVDIIPIVDEIGLQGVNYMHPVFAKNKIDLLLGAFDNIASRIHLTIIAYYHNIPYVDGGMWGPFGNVFVMMPPTSSCYVCSLSEDSWAEMIKRLQCSMKDIVENVEMPSLPTTSSIVAAIQVQEALKILFSKKNADKQGLGEPALGKMIYFNLFTNDWMVYEVPKNPSCPVCSNIGRTGDAPVTMASVSFKK
jgi:molybdopterin/thiamine biosynthesis adenylyltransferase